MQLRDLSHLVVEMLYLFEVAQDLRVRPGHKLRRRGCCLLLLHDQARVHMRGPAVIEIMPKLGCKGHDWKDDK